MYERSNHRLVIEVRTIQMRVSVLVIIFYLLILHIRLIVLVVIPRLRWLVLAARTQDSLVTPYPLFLLRVTRPLLG